MRAWLGIYFKGLAMGIADTIPGVSGGTIALIVGIYDRLVTAIASLDPRVLSELLEIHRAEARGQIVDEINRMDVPFLIVLGIGIMTAILVLSRGILIVFQTYPAEVNAFFFGLIGASAIIIYRDVELNTPPRVLASLVGFLLAFFIAGLAADGGNGTLPIVFVAGAIAISAMVLPGISGAAFLYILGQYEFLLDELHRTVDGVLSLLTGGSPTNLVESSIVVITFIVGAMIGLLTTAHVVSFAFDRYPVPTLAFLTSLMVGALRLPIEEIHGEIGTPAVMEASILLVIVILGALVVMGLDWATESLDYV